jgi:hypothetical protein
MRIVAVVLFTAVALAADRPLLKKTPIDKSVDAALEFLANTQVQEDGSWTAGRSGKSLAVTALSVMAFLSAGHVPGEGKYGKVIEKGARWVLSQQRANGLLSPEGNVEMYHHGIATLMLAEVSGMTDRKLGDECRAALVKAVAVILKAQRLRGDAAGGWRYRVEHVEGSDLSVSGWQIMALRAARNVGCDVPAEAIASAVDYVKRCSDPRTGGFRYMPYSFVTAACTGTGVLCLELSSKKEHRGELSIKGADFLIRRDNLPRWGGPYFFYGIYYGAQATFQVGGNYWTTYRSNLHRILLRNQGKTGSWLGEGTDSMYGPNYCTALAVLALTVEYRLLPIYQRGEEKEDGK